MRRSNNVLMRLLVAVALTVSAVMMMGLSASAQDGEPTQEILDDGTINQSTGEGGSSQSVDGQGNIDQNTGDVCQVVDDQGNINQGPCETPTEVPTEQPTEVPTEQPTEVPTEQPTKEANVQPAELATPVVVAELPVTGQGSSSQNDASLPLALGAAATMLLLVGGAVAWMQRRTA